MARMVRALRCPPMQRRHHVSNHLTVALFATALAASAARNLSEYPHDTLDALFTFVQLLTPRAGLALAEGRGRPQSTTWRYLSCERSPACSTKASKDTPD
eukprot:5661967-Alexandrium_andersonii.AAC.1